MEYFVALFFLVANFLDYKSTDYALAHGAKEQNPVILWLMDNVKDWRYVKMGTAVIAALALAAWGHPILTGLLFVLGAFISGVAFGNWRNVQE